MMSPWRFAGFLARPRHGMVYGLNETLPLFSLAVAGRCDRAGGNKLKQKSSPFGPNLGQTKRMAIPNPNILVVEDDRETRTLIAKYLRNNACNVTAVSDGREMSRAMADHRVDLIILDVMLPGEDGLSLCRKVRAEGQTPIIMLTARGEDVDRIVGLERGADDYLPKPFNPRELLARINAVLRRQATALNASATPDATALAFLGWQMDFRL